MKIKIEGVEVEATQELLEKVKAALAAPKQTAKEWLAEFVEKPFDKVIAKGGCITYYRNGQWIFRQDFENKNLWCYYFEVWQFLEKEFGMEYSDIQSLHKEVVGEALNCKEFTPHEQGLL